MKFRHKNYTMEFKDALLHGIDYREFEKVSRLPSDVELTAIAGVWGDYVNIRCLLFDAEGNGYMRNIRRWGDKGYLIKELGIDAKDIAVGQLFRLAETE